MLPFTILNFPKSRCPRLADPSHGPQMILDHKWSPKSSENDPVKIRSMEWILWDSLQKLGLIIKKNLFLSTSKEKGKEDTTSQVNLYKVKKKWIYDRKDMISTVYFFLCHYDFNLIHSRMFRPCKKLRQAGHYPETTLLF